jgi:putative SOS response-associated peptidase YedK
MAVRVRGILDARFAELTVRPCRSPRQTKSKRFQHIRIVSNKQARMVRADGFFEWQKVGAAKQPCNLGLKGDEPFAFAGLWEWWRDPATQEEVKTCSIITTTPHDLTAPMHDRMPIILPTDRWPAWLALEAARRNCNWRAEQMALATRHRVQIRQAGLMHRVLEQHRRCSSAESLWAIRVLRGVSFHQGANPGFVFPAF